jgi:hypothetical protein
VAHLRTTKTKASAANGLLFNDRADTHAEAQTREVDEAFTAKDYALPTMRVAIDFFRHLVLFFFRLSYLFSLLFPTFFFSFFF